MSKQLSVTICFLAVLNASAASQVVSPVSVLGAPKTTSTATKSGQALINGSANDSAGAPYAGATVRLRNLLTNEVEQLSVANEAGQFAFMVLPEVPYVVEVLDRQGNLLAVGEVITVQAGEVAAALVTVPARVPAVAGLFGGTALSVLASAASLGIVALDPPPPLSPEK